MMHEIFVEQANSNDPDYRLIAWAVSSGDRVVPGEVLAELETSKVNMEVVADRAGIFRISDEMETVFSPGDVIGVIYDTEEEFSQFDVAKPAAELPAVEADKLVTRPARELMDRHHLDLQRFQDLDRPVIRVSDVKAMLRRETQATQPPDRPFANQQDVARVVSRSHLEKPSSFAVLKVDYSVIEQGLARYRAQNKSYLGLVEVLIKVLSDQAASFPQFFTRLDRQSHDETTKGVNVGVTMDLGNGLFLPVLHDVQQRSLSDIARELIDHRRRAQEGVFKERHLSDGHITLSVNTEKDVLHVIPIIHPEQTAMLTLGGLLETVRLDRSGKAVRHQEFHLGVAYDHRWINGRQAVQLLGAVKACLESSQQVAQTLGLAEAPATSPAAAPSPTTDSASEDALLPALINALQSAVREVDQDAYGLLPADEMMNLTSVEIVGLLAKLQEAYPDLKVSALYECQTIRALAEYLQAQHPQEARRHCQAVPAAEPLDAVAKPPLQRKAAPTGENQLSERSATWADGIAVIGMSGRFPQAPNVHAFWRNLQDMQDCITEIPRERWDATACLQRWQEVGKPVAQFWGGFLDDVDRFDAGFFRIAPVDAELMDPQQRLYLEVAWETLEDAGYSLERIRERHANRVGVFTGVWYSDYGFIGLDRQLQGIAPSTWPSHAAISNRVSHSFDFTGPSHAVDAMCASSLVSVHLACQSLLDGECELALAGGVNLSLHPQKYLMLKERQFLSSDGRCRSFGAGGDGYVPSEAVGAVLLKPLDKALADGDPIHGVIIGSACNHSGKTSGFTVPNPRVQAEVIEAAIARAEIDPRAVSYIEAHGAGTRLGDPIEIAGLTAAYQKIDQNGEDIASLPLCAIGSVKSNIGHCEASAGIAGLIKVLLQLKHRKIVGSLHAQSVNEHIDFQETRFRLQQANAPWQRPRVATETGEQEWPRIAGISSFGAGGVNAHLLVKEFTSQETAVSQPGPYPILLSAKSDDRLQQMARNLLAFLQQDQGRSTSVEALAYTLQTGREAMAVRLGLLVHSLAELMEKLERFINSGGESVDVAVGRTHPGRTHPGRTHPGRTDSATTAVGQGPGDDLESLLATKSLEPLVKQWVSGAEVDWDRLYSNPPRRINLPTYPFKDQRYWLPDQQIEPGPEPTPTPNPMPAQTQSLDRSTAVVERQVAYQECLRRIADRSLDAEGLIRVLERMEISA